MICGLRLEVGGLWEWSICEWKWEVCGNGGVGWMEIYVAKGYKERILWLVLYWFLLFFIADILYNLLWNDTIYRIRCIFYFHFPKINAFVSSIVEIRNECFKKIKRRIYYARKNYKCGSRYFK